MSGFIEGMQRGADFVAGLQAYKTNQEYHELRNQQLKQQLELQALTLAKKRQYETAAAELFQPLPQVTQIPVETQVPMADMGSGSPQSMPPAAMGLAPALPIGGNTRRTSAPIPRAMPTEPRFAVTEAELPSRGFDIADYGMDKSPGYGMSPSRPGHVRQPIYPNRGMEPTGATLPMSLGETATVVTPNGPSEFHQLAARAGIRPEIVEMINFAHRTGGPEAALALFDEAVKSTWHRGPRGQVVQGADGTMQVVNLDDATTRPVLGSDGKPIKKFASSNVENMGPYGVEIVSELTNLYPDRMQQLEDSIGTPPTFFDVQHSGLFSAQDLSLAYQSRNDRKGVSLKAKQQLQQSGAQAGVTAAIDKRNKVPLSIPDTILAGSPAYGTTLKDLTQQGTGGAGSIPSGTPSAGIPSNIEDLETSPTPTSKVLYPREARQKVAQIIQHVPLNQHDRDQLQASMQAMVVLNDISEAAEAVSPVMPGVVNRGAAWIKNTKDALAQTPGNGEAVAMLKSKAGEMGVLARTLAQEKGVLTEQDVQRINNLMPSSEDTLSMRRKKMQSAIAIMQRGIDNYIAVLTRNRPSASPSAPASEEAQYFQEQLERERQNLQRKAGGR